MSALAVQYDHRGLYLPNLGLWLDPHEAQPGPDKVFISHAHSDHTALHREIIVSAATSRLMRARMRGDWQEIVLAYREARQFEHRGVAFTVTLLPAGHIYGSAMALIEAGGSSLLYTGDFKLRPSLSAESCEPHPADVLIMECTYGRREYRFPPAGQVLEGVIHFCREALNHEETPVLLGYSLGKSQELLCGLAQAGLPLMLHEQVYQLTELYKAFGHSFPAYSKFEKESARGKVLVCPPQASHSAALRHAAPVRSAVLTGWAMDPGCKYRFQAQAAFPLSDHADFPELLEMVRRVNPKKIYLVHGFTAEFAQTLRELGRDAQALGQEEQLTLPLAATRSAATPPAVDRLAEPPVPAPAPQIEPPEITVPPNSFHGFAITCRAIGSTPKKLEKIRHLADFLRSLDDGSVAPVNSWFTGNPFPPSQNKVLRLGWAIIRDALCEVTGMDHSDFGQVYLKHSDLGETAFEILRQRKTPAASLTLSSVNDLFEQIYAARGPTGKQPLLSEALRRCSPLEGKYLVKILTGDLRIGLKEGLLEEAIAATFNVPLDQVKTANLLTGNIGETALLARRNALREATLVPFRPVKFMLASPEETAVDIWKRAEQWSLTGADPVSSDSRLNSAPVKPALTVWIEDKYDGIRCQLHKRGDQVALYSRDLKEITLAFMEIVDLARPAAADFVLDGEIMAMRNAEALPFAELQRRLGRRERDLFLGEEIPVQYVVFDLLWLNHQSLLDLPLHQRRSMLEQLKVFPLSQITLARSPEEIDSIFRAVKQRGHEGLLIKDPSSAYSPGRRGLAWLKLKKAHATLDCVVVGAEYGHGKRKDLLSDYTFAVRDETTGALKIIGKAYTGLTDAEISELTQLFLKKQIRQHGRFLEVEPDVVLEIAFDAIQVSDRHTSGLAMRFPRIVRIRRDKSPTEIDTLATARSLVKTG